MVMKMLKCKKKKKIDDVTLQYFIATNANSSTVRGATLITMHLITLLGSLRTVLSLINAPGALQFFKRGMFIRGKFSMQKCSG